MKKILLLLLALVMCLGCFAACTSGNDPLDTTATGGDTTATEEATNGATGTTLEEAVDYLRSIYKDNAKETPADYDVVGKIIIGQDTFTVTWTTDNAGISVKEGKTAGFYTIDLPAKNDAVVDYKLTATVADANGKTQDVSFDRTLPVYDASAIVAKPEEGTAYKFYMVHAALGQTLFATGETQDNANKYIISTTDPKAAPDFFVEADGEGFKFYTEIGGTKTYILAKTTTSDDGKVSKYIGYSTETGTTWTYKSETNGWYTTIDGIEYVVGTYGTYSTFCISEGTYLTVENSGTTQFPGGLMLKETAEAMTPSAGPTIYETPEEIVKAAYELELNGILSGGHTYTLTGVITDIPSPYDEAYGNATVVIVVGDMTDMPIECFRLKGEGIEKLKVGDIITVSGQILKYDNKSETGKVEFNTGCTLDAYKNGCEHEEEIIPGKAATCTEAGLTEGKQCSKCGEIFTAQEEIPATGHTPGDEATCSAAQICTVCNTELVAALPHTPGDEATCTTAQICTVCETELVAALGHDWSPVYAQDDDNHWVICTRCDETKDQAAHELGDDEICDVCGYGCEHENTSEPTCTAPGVCADCGSAVVNPKGHTEEVVPGKAATCTEKGLTDGKKCSVCNETLLAQSEIPAAGHKEETVAAVAPTCKDTGLTEGKKCSVCGTVTKAQETVAKTENHVYDNDKDATCNVCGAERQVAKMVVLYYPKDNKYATGTEHFYSPKKMELTLSDSKAEAIALEQITNADGSVSFKAGNKWLYADGTHVEFVSAAGDNTKFVLEETDGGVLIRCHTANYNGKAQYLEVYSGYLTVYGLNSDLSIFTFVLQDADGANGKVQDDANSKVEGNGGSSTPSTPSTGATSISGGVTSVSVDQNYKLAGVNASGQMYFDGTLNNGRINATATGITVKLEAGAAANEYYIYFMDGSTKTYIGMAGEDDSSDFAFSTTKSDSCVWTIDASAKTIVSKANPKRGMATQNGSTFSNYSTYAISNFGNDSGGYGIYVPCWFVAA